MLNITFELRQVSSALLVHDMCRYTECRGTTFAIYNLSKYVLSKLC
jgi:hypothetical protein